MTTDKSLIEQSYDHPVLLETFSLLNLKFLYSNHFTYTENTNIDFDYFKLKKAIWLCSILASSSDVDHKVRAQRFASLLYLTKNEEGNNIDVVKACYVLFSRLGNLTATRFFTQLNTKIEDSNILINNDYDGVLSLELILQRQSKTIKTNNGSILVTSFQKGLWNGLNDISKLAVSAPTSSGKSYILKQFLSETFALQENYKALYIVPSRALINQVSEEFRIELKGTNTLIRTAYIQDNDKEDTIDLVKEVFRENKILYVLTPERCIKLLAADLEEKIPMDFIFIDEIQGVENDQGRGATFENVFEDLSLQFFKAKLVTAGPHILNPEKTYQELFNKEAAPFKTKLSPVIQFKKIIRADGKGDLEVEVRDNINKSILLNIQTSFNADSLIKNKRNGTILEKIINLLAPNKSNIVFSNRGDYAENWAREYQESIGEVNISKRVKELIDFLKDEFNKDYYLIDCLERGVAFHHGKLPDIIRKEVEELFQDKEINNLFCTSTLIEGVNLPANNLFIIIPKKNIEDLTDFEFGNLIGRAGRLSESLYGTIYFIEKADYKGKSAIEYFEADYEKEITIYSTQNIPEYDFKYLRSNINDIEIYKEDGKRDVKSILKQKQLTLFIRNRYIKNENSVSNYLVKKGVSLANIENAIIDLKNTLSDILIPKKIILENQSIDPILQNELYIAIQNKDIEDWVITPNSILEKRRKKEDVLEKPNKDRPFFWQLLTIFKGLDEIFNISQEAFENYKISNINSTVMAIHATTWLQGLSYKQLIDNDIRFYSTDSRVSDEDKLDPNDKKEVNKLINKIIKINSSIVTYLLVKYVKLLVDILDTTLTEDQKEKYKITLGLPTALELGTRDKNVKNLISSGISRSVAISVVKQYKSKTTEAFREDNSILDWLSSKEKINGLKPIYNRYLKRLKLLK
ncbi:DEAD/DEAH box helicase [Maribacter sp. 2308TA10-17]|uniref:DEAD/DEAH box helicase n=1 Tax=Maribacter sp. 2308TA10-17 TaxID=3386276 RepID=UPI0039BD8349